MINDKDRKDQVELPQEHVLNGGMKDAGDACILDAQAPTFYSQLTLKM